MNDLFGDKHIALEPIPNDATAVVVRVDTWKKMESALATLRAELDAKTAECEKLREAILTVEKLIGPRMNNAKMGGRTHTWLGKLWWPLIDALRDRE